MFLFDVLEHLEDEDAFLDAVLFHLAPGRAVVLNVPALQPLWSKNDLRRGEESLGATSE